jgi:hypothetical protein
MSDILTSTMVLGVYAIVMAVLAATFWSLWH